MIRGHWHCIFEILTAFGCYGSHPPPFALLTVSQNFLKYSCLRQQCTTPDTLPFLPRWLQSCSLFVLDFSIPRILLHSVWKSTCQVQNKYHGEPFDAIFNQWNVFFGIVDQAFSPHYSYNNVLFVWSWMWQGICNGSEWRKTKKWRSDLFLVVL